ncbi:AzlD domain-containing protein [Haladaptatus sp. GCM10025707]|uniref:AzlD domain-containing protein n=1 Tax=unclassified Haladaptatus TaxID=2622732 RepID=UPI0023E8D249|nr:MULTISPECIES: AzlD domain-containing protein [unclassified Haladaptatus]
MAVNIDPLTLWGIILVAGLGTFLIRLSFIQLFGWMNDLPPRAERALGFVPAAVLAALVVPSFLLVDESLALTFSNHRLIAGIIAGAVAWRTENLVATLVTGMVVLWILTVLL